MGPRLKSFLRGVASIFDIGGSPPRRMQRPMTAEEALAQDWQRVGDDLRYAMGIPTQELKYWGFSEALGPVLRRRFRGTEEQAIEIAQQFANQRVADVDYWDEADKSAKPGAPALSLRTVNPLPLFLEERRQREAEDRRVALRKTWSK